MTSISSSPKSCPAKSIGSESTGRPPNKANLSFILSVILCLYINSINCDYCSLVTLFFKMPISGISISTVSPCAIGPTPEGVPVKITSPGIKVIAALI